MQIVADYLVRGCVFFSKSISRKLLKSTMLAILNLRVVFVMVNSVMVIVFSGILSVVILSVERPLITVVYFCL